MILTALNLVLPGAGFFWRKSPLLAFWYLASFASMARIAPDFGALWAIYVWVMAQVHFRLQSRARGYSLDRATIVVIWGTAVLLLGLFLTMFAPYILHQPWWLAPSTGASLLVPAVLLTYAPGSEKRTDSLSSELALRDNEGD